MPTPQQQQHPAIAVPGNSDSSTNRKQHSNSYVCTFCGEAFTVLFDWTRHVRKHASSTVTLNLQARNGSVLRPTPINGEPAKAHSTTSQQQPELLATTASSTPSPDAHIAPTNNTTINGDSPSPGDRSAATRQDHTTDSNKDLEVEAPSRSTKQETEQNPLESNIATASPPYTETFPITAAPMDAQTPPSQGSNSSAPIATRVASLPPPPEALAAETIMPTTTNSQRTESALSTKSVQSRASVSMPVALSRVTSVATRNQSRSELKPAHAKVDTPLTASSVSFPMPSPAVPTPTSSSSSSSSPSSSVLRKTKRHRTQSDIDDEADFDITVEPLSQPEEDNSRFRCLWRQTQSLSERHPQHQHHQQQQGLPETSRSKGKSRAMEISTIAETCRISFESDIELIGHYVRHISLMEALIECPVKLCKTILPTERHLQMHLERFHPEIKSKATLKAGTRKKPPSTDSPDTPRRGSSRSATPASTSGRTAPQALQQTKQRRTRMQTKGSKTVQTAPPVVSATKRVFKESTSAVSATKRVFRESSPAVSAKRIKGSPPPKSAAKREIKGSTPPVSATSLSAPRDISESIAAIDRALSLGAFFSPPKKSNGKIAASRTRG